MKQTDLPSIWMVIVGSMYRAAIFLEQAPCWFVRRDIDVCFGLALDNLI